jgi:membrane protein DedA with SNARE-associated domain
MEQLILLIERHGPLLVWGNVFLSQAGLPVPAMPTLLIAGALAARGGTSWPVLLAGAVAVSLIVDYVWYLAGARFGERTLQSLYRIFPLPRAQTRTIASALERWGTVSLVVAKFVPGLALVAPPIAGMARIRPAVFLTANGLGAALWAGLPIALGAYHRESIHEALAAAGDPGPWAGMLAVAAIVTFIAWRRSHIGSEGSNR